MAHPSLENIPSAQLKTPCCSGTQPFRQGEFVCTINCNEKGVDQIHDVYRILSRGYIDFWERRDDNDDIIESTNQVGIPGYDDYPPLADLYRLHACPVNNSSAFRIISLQYKVVKPRNQLSWPTESAHGILQSQYISHFEGRTFNQISKSYRQSGFTDNNHFSDVKAHNPTINWHNKFQRFLSVVSMILSPSLT